MFRRYFFGKRWRWTSGVQNASWCCGTFHTSESPHPTVIKYLKHLYSQVRALVIVASDLSRPWFFGDVTTEQAKQLLTGQPTGTFLIRYSSKGSEGSLAASFVGKNGKVLKALITRSNGGYQVENRGRKFKVVDELIQYYQNEGYFSQPFQPE
jgi:hypothetical protein